jgi:periplasmic protein TonB
MFNNLVESASHRRELARKGRFFLGALGLYGILLACAGVASVYAYNARLDDNIADSYEVFFVPPAAPEERPPETTPDKSPRPKPAAGGGDELPTRKELIAGLHTTPKTPPPVSTAPPTSKPMPPGLFRPGERDYDPVRGYGSGTQGTNFGGVVPGGHNSRVVPVEEDPKPPEPTPTPAPQAAPTRISVPSTILVSKIIDKPAPAYPEIAKRTGVSGAVPVEILIDEEGRVISARAVGGHLFLKPAAQQAALRARFTPTQLNGRPVKVSGVITYNFVLR